MTVAVVRDDSGIQNSFIEIPMNVWEVNRDAKRLAVWIILRNTANQSAYSTEYLFDYLQGVMTPDEITDVVKDLIDNGSIRMSLDKSSDVKPSTSIAFQEDSFVVQVSLIFIPKRLIGQPIRVENLKNNCPSCGVAMDEYTEDLNDDWLYRVQYCACVEKLFDEAFEFTSDETDVTIHMKKPFPMHLLEST